MIHWACLRHLGLIESAFNAHFSLFSSRALTMFRHPLILATLLLLASSRPAYSQNVREFDIVVYGGTSGGVIAAVQAVVMGKSVVLVEPGKHLGGLTSGGLGATDIGNKG